MIPINRNVLIENLHQENYITKSGIYLKDEIRNSTHVIRGLILMMPIDSNNDEIKKGDIVFFERGKAEKVNILSKNKKEHYLVYENDVLCKEEKED